MMDFSNIISARRKELKMTQRDLAEKINVSDKTISRWETGLQIPDASIIPALAAALQISIEELYGNKKADLVNQEEVDLEKIGSFKAFMIVAYIIQIVLFIIQIIGLSGKGIDNSLTMLLPIIGFIVILIIFSYKLVIYRNFYLSKFYNKIYHQKEILLVSLFLIIFIGGFGIIVILNSIDVASNKLIGAIFNSFLCVSLILFLIILINTNKEKQKKSWWLIGIFFAAVIYVLVMNTISLLSATLLWFEYEVLIRTVFSFVISSILFLIIIRNARTF